MNCIRLCSELGTSTTTRTTCGSTATGAWRRYLSMVSDPAAVPAAL